MLRITRSLLQRSRRSARRPGRGAAGGSLSIPMLPRRLTVAPFLQPTTERFFRHLASSLVTSGGLPILPLQERDWFDQDDAAGLDAFDCCRRMHAPDLPSSLQSSRLLCLPLSGARLCRKTAHACSDCACLPALPDKLRLCTTVVGLLTVTRLRVHCIDAAAVASPPY